MSEQNVDRFSMELAGCRRELARIEHAIDEHLDADAQRVTSADVGKAKTLRWRLERIALGLGCVP